MDKHLKKFNQWLQGKKVQDVRWMLDKEMEDLMWHTRPVVIQFTDGTIIIPQRDDEGNDGGAMMYQDIKENGTIYTT